MRLTFYILHILAVMVALLVLASCASSDINDDAVVNRLQQIEKKIAFSFDDTPRHQGAFLSQTERREILIKSLQNSGVKQAVFFLNPARMDKDEFKDIHMDNINAYAVADHVFANHPADHNASIIPTIG